MSPVTPLHLLLLKDLFKMSVSHYSEVGSQQPYTRCTLPPPPPNLPRSV